MHDLRRLKKTRVINYKKTGWMDEWVDRWAGGWMSGLMDEWVDRWEGGW